MRTRLLGKINRKGYLKILEAYNGLSAKIVEESEFDGIWVSSLTHSASKGLPDIELIPLSERVDLVREIRRVSTKPICVDVDTGGGHFGYHAKWFKDAGADALIIEDKAFPKRNSLLDTLHNLEDIDKFCEKIREASNSGVMVIARVESLIAKHSMYEALIRADAYVDAGANGIMIHSKQKVDCSEVMDFAKEFKKKHKNIPLIAIPSTYELPKKHPFNIVIYANMMLRASLLAMKKVAEAKNPKKVEMASIEDIFKLI